MEGRRPNDRHGRNGEDLVLRVPVGTIVYAAGDEKPAANLITDGQEYVASKGGGGGRGNASFSTSTLQDSKVRRKGEPVDETALVLELKLLADVGSHWLPERRKIDSHKQDISG